MKILVDMNLSPRWATLLTSTGFETKHWSTLGEAGASDTKIMTFAKANGCTVLTHSCPLLPTLAHDLDFGVILVATHGQKPSVGQTRARDVSPNIAGEFVVAAFRQMEAELEAGALLTIDPDRVRLRLLPLRLVE